MPEIKEQVNVALDDTISFSLGDAPFQVALLPQESAALAETAVKVNRKRNASLEAVLQRSSLADALNLLGELYQLFLTNSRLRPTIEDKAAMLAAFQNKLIKGEEYSESEVIAIVKDIDNFATNLKEFSTEEGAIKLINSFFKAIFPDMKNPFQVSFNQFICPPEIIGNIEKIRDIADKLHNQLNNLAESSPGRRYNLIDKIVRACGKVIDVLKSVLSSVFNVLKNTHYYGSRVLIATGFKNESSYDKKERGRRIEERGRELRAAAEAQEIGETFLKRGATRP